MVLSDRLRRIFEVWVGLPNVTAARRWGLVAVIDSVGTGMRVPITVLYFTVAVGLPLEGVGIFLGVAGLIATVGAPIAGALTDTFGAKRMIIVCFVLAAAGYGGYLLVREWVLFVVVVTAAQLADYAAKPAKQAFVAQIVQAEHRVSLMAFNRSIRNVGYGVGGLLTAGLLLFSGDVLGFHIVFVIDAVSYLVAAFVVARIKVDDLVVRPEQVTKSEKQAKKRGFREVLADRRYVALAFLDVLVLAQGVALNVGLPLWVHGHTNMPTSTVGVLFAVNNALVVIFQVRFTKGLVTARQSSRIYVRSAVAFGLAALFYSLAGSLDSTSLLIFALLISAVLAHTVCELCASAAQWTVAFDLAPPALRGRYLSLFALSNSMHHAIGPGVVAVLIAQVPGLTWWVLLALQAVGCLTTAWLVRNAPSRQDEGLVTPSAPAKETSA